MGRQSEWKVEYANAVYHVAARGNKRKTIYRDNTDRRRFRETLEEARLGGERMTTVAAGYGYRDGYGVHRVVERLEKKANDDQALARRLKALDGKLSSVKSRPRCPLIWLP